MLTVRVKDVGVLVVVDVVYAVVVVVVGDVVDVVDAVVVVVVGDVVDVVGDVPTAAVRVGQSTPISVPSEAAFL